MLKCECGRVISEKAMRQEIGRLMAERRPKKATLTPEQAREYGRKGALKRWGKTDEASLNLEEPPVKAEPPERRRFRVLHKHKRISVRTKRPK
jgi:hypothetical protein